MKSKSKKEKQPKVSDELKGFDIRINSFGEIESSVEIDEINKFLNRKVDDKKLRGREDIDK